MLASEGRQRYIYRKTHKNIKEKKESNAQGKIILIRISFLIKNSTIFGLFFGLVSADADAPFAVVHPVSKGVGDLLFSDGSDDPLQTLLSFPGTVRGQPAPTLPLGRKKKSAGAIIGK